ncbi:MAG: hypothetical protein NTY32_09170, partial [Bacteroidia bacterium]|nr:hypothetical protein [Bacteroidia bacterium]
NKDIYSSDTLPVELYTDKDVRKVLIKCNDKVLKTIKILKEGYVADHLVLKSKGNWTLIPE